LYSFYWLKTGAASLSRLLGVAAIASAISPLEMASLLPLMMSTFAKMHLNTVPPTDGFAWFVEKTSSVARRRNTAVVAASDAHSV
jgi:hypothetical protein